MLPAIRESSFDANIRVRENKKIKDQANAICKAIGTDLSAVIRTYVRAIVRTRSIPRMESGYTLEGEDMILAADREIDDDRKRGKLKVHKNVDSLMEDLKK
ncbi:MAG TPA: type II toxin-antitoxin system RelB/DinJ family antitoxin [Bdellovibrionota bacterium]|nr:type II toxin-antitoxin system RelB/DinJ family antitoxin [Bdellovibrionota bacterium]